jgi:hypothetical protein
VGKRPFSGQFPFPFEAASIPDSDCADTIARVHASTSPIISCDPGSPHMKKPHGLRSNRAVLARFN